MSFFWRLVLSRFADQPLSGEGARLWGGRWNEPGIGMIYAAESRALAALEVLVHLNGVYPEDSFKLLCYEIDDALIETLPASKLPADWRANPASSSTALIGSIWVRESRSVGFEVPSSVIPEEMNLLINPNHGDIRNIGLGKARDFTFDNRLFA